MLPPWFGHRTSIARGRTSAAVGDARQPGCGRRTSNGRSSCAATHRMRKRSLRRGWNASSTCNSTWCVGLKREEQQCALGTDPSLDSAQTARPSLSTQPLQKPATSRSVQWRKHHPEADHAVCTCGASAVPKGRSTTCCSVDPTAAAIHAIRPTGYQRVRGRRA